MSEFPSISELSKPFWEGCKMHELRLQYCRNCKKYQWYPRPLCVTCGKNQLEWRTCSGNGQIHSFTIVRFPVQTYKNPVYFKDFPYIVGMIELDEGVRMYSRVLDCDLGKVEIGMKVELAFVRLSSDLEFPAFRPSGMR